MSFRNDDDFDSASYVKVNVRLQQFWEKYPNGRVETGWTIVENSLLAEAKLFRTQEDANPASVGHAYLEDIAGEKVGEYTETVAVGRALALMGFSVEKSIASSEEMDKFAKRQEARGDSAPSRGRSRGSKIQPAAEVKKEDSKPAEKQETKETKPEAAASAPAAAASKPETTAAAAPAPLRTSRIFKPLSRQGATGGVANG